MLIIIILLLLFSAAIANEIKERKTAIEKEFTERKEEIKRIDGNHYFLFLMTLVNNYKFLNRNIYVLSLLL